MSIQRELTRTQAESWLDLATSLSDSLERYRTLFEHAPVGYITLDGRGVVIEANAVGLEFLCETPQHVSGKPLLCYVYGADTKLLVSHLLRCASGGATTELRLRQREGPPRPVQLMSRQIALRGLQTVRGAYLTVVIDVSSQRQMEHALHESEKRHRMIVETAHEGICIVDAANRIVFASRRFAAMVGGTPDDLLGLSAFDLIPKGDLASARSIVETLEAAGGGQSEERLRRMDGSTIWTNVSTSVMTDEKGQFAGMLRMYTDASARHHLSESRDLLMRELVAAQEQERARIARELHDQMGQHIVALSLGLARIAALCAEVPGAEGTLRQLQQVSEQLGRDIHTLALELRPAALDHLGLSVALASYVDDLAKRTGLEIDAHCDDVSALGLSSAAQTGIYRIAQEAVSNVVKHAHARHVSVILERHADALQLIVEDDGVGFNQLAPHKGRARLGMAGMQERAAILGGTLNVESTRGRGTTVYLRMPIHATGTQLDETAATVAR